MQIDSCTSGPTVNLTELLGRVDNDRDLVCELFEMFKEEYPHFLQALREAVAARDMKLVMSASHTLKGMLANLAITHAAETALRLEKMGRNGETGGLVEALALLEENVASATPEMDSYVAEVRR